MSQVSSDKPQTLCSRLCYCQLLFSCNAPSHLPLYSKPSAAFTLPTTPPLARDPTRKASVWDQNPDLATRQQWAHTGTRGREQRGPTHNTCDRVGRCDSQMPMGGKGPRVRRSGSSAGCHSSPTLPRQPWTDSHCGDKDTEEAASVWHLSGVRYAQLQEHWSKNI